VKRYFPCLIEALEDAISFAIHFFIEGMLIISLYFHQYKKKSSFNRRFFQYINFNSYYCLSDRLCQTFLLGTTRFFSSRCSHWSRRPALQSTMCPL